ncbi:MAG TPA: hypothetical protein VLK65_10085 [Vicinamibacteria bacterium]|nr:hypothetical protein [Vicinamibacteria bacterium]
MGPVITVDSGGDILVALEDPDFGNSLPLLFRSFGLQGTEPRVQYDGLNCIGNPYIIQPSTHSGAFVRLLGYSYGVGPGSGGDLWIFRGSDVAIPQPTIQSMWINGACSNSGGFGTLTNAAEIINITNDFPGPYTLE